MEDSWMTESLHQHGLNKLHYKLWFLKFHTKFKPSYLGGFQTHDWYEDRIFSFEFLIKFLILIFQVAIKAIGNKCVTSQHKHLPAFG